jgi:hypothetical protein
VRSPGTRHHRLMPWRSDPVESAFRPLICTDAQWVSLAERARSTARVGVLQTTVPRPTRSRAPRR